MGKELKAQTDTRKKQYKKLNDTHEFDKLIKKDKPSCKKYNRSTLIYDSKYRFYPYYNNKDLNSLSLKPNYLLLFSFYSNLNKFNNLNQRKENNKEEKRSVYNNASELYRDYLEIYFDEYKVFSNGKKSRVINIILLIYLLKHVIMISGFKVKNCLIQQEKVIKKIL